MRTIRPRASERTVWLSEELTFRDSQEEDLCIDLSAMRQFHPLFAVQLQLFIDWSRAAGRLVSVVPPQRSEVAATVRDIGLSTKADLPIGGAGVPAMPSGEVVMPLLRLTKDHQVDEIADALFQMMNDHLDDVAVVRHAVHAAVSELCQNALEHGENSFGCVTCASRGDDRGSRRFTFAVGDLGVGVPDHVRRQHPDWEVDEYAIAQAVEQGVTGTSLPHRGIGFHSIAEETLASAATGAELRIRAGSGKFRRVIRGANPLPEGGPSPPVRGSWIVYEWTTVTGC
jgi:anti-sigma regulatory factor (Ser/Thr protein kinase)